MSKKRSRLPYPAPIGDLLTATFSGTPTGKRLRESRVWLVWESVVGKQIANRAQPVAFRDGTLIVSVSSAPWMQQLNFLKQGIQERLNSCLGEEMVKDIYLRAGKSERIISPEAPGALQKRSLSHSEQQCIERDTGSIDDPELKQALMKLLSKHLTSKTVS